MTLASKFNIQPESELDKLRRLVVEAESDVKRAVAERDQRYATANANTLRSLQMAVAAAEIKRDAAVKRLRKVEGK